MNAKKPVKRGQHVIPRMHLQHFASKVPPRHVWSYRKSDGEVFHAIPEETGKQSHFYSIENDDGTYDTRIEDHLSEVEDAATPVYNKLLADGPANLSVQQKADFAHFAALLHVRTVAARNDAARAIGQMSQIMTYAHAAHDGAFESMIRGLEADKGEKIPGDVKAKVRQWMLNPAQHYTVEVPKERTFIALGAADKLTEIFLQMHWTVARPKHGFFITSDNPVTRQVDLKSVHPAYGDLGFINKTAQVTLPLSPGALLLMRWGEDLWHELSVDRARVESINRTRAFFADEYLYAHIDHKSIRRLATDHRDSRPKLETVGFGPKQFGTVSVPRRWPKDV